MADDALARIARLRVPLGFVVGAIVLWLAQPTPRTLALGGILAVLGESLRIWAAGHINKSREVTTSGPYRWLAHPLYVGSSMMGIGLAIASNRVANYVAIVVYLAVTIAVAIKTEEAHLRRAFGDQYDQYRGGPSREAPNKAGSRRPFGIGQAIRNREYRAVIGLALVMALLLLKLL